MRLFLALATLLLLAGPAQADTLYGYTSGPLHVSGLPYVERETRIVLSFTMAESEMIDYAFSDGVQTLTPANSSVFFRLGSFGAQGFGFNSVVGATATAYPGATLWASDLSGTLA
jgi:hypothetical protein